MDSLQVFLIAGIAFAGFIGGALEGYWLARILFRWFRSRKKSEL